MSETMKALVYRGPEKIGLEDRGCSCTKNY
jgi:hypothetical protein